MQDGPCGGSVRRSPPPTSSVAERDLSRVVFACRYRLRCAFGKGSHTAISEIFWHDRGVLNANRGEAFGELDGCGCAGVRAGNLRTGSWLAGHAAEAEDRGNHADRPY
jgi:hypothetical protein